MTLTRYREVLALPGVRSLVVLGLLARIPTTATGITLTLHVVLGLHRSYGAAGLVGALGTVGAAIGAPLMGKLVDASGLRVMLLLTTAGEAVFWFTAPWLSYPWLLVTAVLGGLLTLPVFGVTRQCMAALVPPAQRRTAYSIDSMSVELSFMAGPALGVLVATRTTTADALLAIGAATIVAGGALYLFNPPTRDESERTAERLPTRSWLTPALLATLASAIGATFALVGTEVAMVAALRGVGQVGWTGLLTIMLCAASLIGGFVYGAIHRAFPPPALVGLMGLLLVPVGLAGGQWWVLGFALAPTNLLCAPALAATGDTVSRLAPAAIRGQAMGLQGSALTLGGALGSPAIGTVVDHLGAGWGFAAAGTGAVVVGVLALTFARTRTPVAVST